MSWMARFFVDIQDMRKHGLRDCYQWHKGIWKCFPGSPDGRRDFLFRLDEMPGGVLAHVLCGREPLRPDICAGEHWQCRAVPDSFLEHSRYRFDVVCNPARKVRAYDADGQRKKNSNRKAVLSGDEQEAWFLRKARDGGFAVQQGLRIDPCRSHLFRKEGQDGTHIAARFCGVLEVQDRDLFRHCFRCGIGSARGFGFGLLLLAPVQHILS